MYEILYFHFHFTTFKLTYCDNYFIKVQWKHKKAMESNKSDEINDLTNIYVDENILLEKFLYSCLDVQYLEHHIIITYVCNR